MTEAETLRKIVALCGPVKTFDGGEIPSSENVSTVYLMQRADTILAHARRVLREKGVDIRYDTNAPLDANRWWMFPATTHEQKMGMPTESACILAALQSMKPKERWSWDGCDKKCYRIWDTDGVEHRAYTATEVVALLNSGGQYTQADLDKAVREAVVDALDKWGRIVGGGFSLHGKAMQEEAAAIREGKVKISLDIAHK